MCPDTSLIDGGCKPLPNPPHGTGPTNGERPCASPGAVVTVRTIADLDRDELAVLGREYLLAGQLIDRAGMPQIISRSGRDVMQAVAIDEWMGASPVYTRRIQRLLGFAGGTDVGTMFKGMQFDIGAPHEFLDFRYLVHDPDHGEFWLDHCGALADVEPMGDDYIVAMCHHIEDPTFEATVCASNSRARMTPVHRPPRVPADRHPQCHWEVRIDPTADELPEPPGALIVAGTHAAGLAVPVIPAAPPAAGRADYTGPVDPDLRLEDFSRDAVEALVREFALQGHLLVLSCFVAVSSHLDAGAAVDVVTKQFIGVAGVVAGRLRDAFGTGDAGSDIATVLELHPALQPRDYVAVRVEPGGRTFISLDDCPATAETVGVGWAALLAGGRADAALDAIVGAVEPRAACVPVASSAGSLRSWEVVLGDEARPEPGEVTLTRFSSGADFEFRRVGPR